MLCRKAAIFITLVCFIICTQGCHTSRQITVQDLEEKPEQKIQKVVMLDNTVYEFPDGGQFIENMIVGYTKEDEFIKLPIEQVSLIYTSHDGSKQPSGPCILGLIAGVTVVMLVAINAFANQVEGASCPFVYAFDGTDYVLEGEPYGGAVCQGLQRIDHCRLDNIDQVEGEYRIMLTNEMDEIQFTDEVTLLTVDHPEDVRVYQDADGHIYTVGEIQKPLYITDTEGNDLKQLLYAQDCLVWESYRICDEVQTSGNLRDTLTIIFPKNHYSKKAKLVVNGCNTVWGSHMLKQMVKH